MKGESGKVSEKQINLVINDIVQQEASGYEKNDFVNIFVWSSLGSISKQVF